MTPEAAETTSAPLVPDGSNRSWEAPPVLEVQGVRFDPALFCAPMAGITHAPFRRLVADFGGCGGFFSEMLPAGWLLSREAIPSPAVLRRPHEGPLVYQVLLGDPALARPVVDRLLPLGPAGIDLNCACPAPVARRSGAGGALFSDRERLAHILGTLRDAFSGLLSVKIRLGDAGVGWQERLFDRIRLFEDLGVDLVTLHPRFHHERWNRRPRDEWYDVLAATTRLPILASGNLQAPFSGEWKPARYRRVAGLMLGRIAAIQPWVFAAWGRPLDPPPALEVWERFCAYVLEDYGPEKGFFRIKAWAPYYAQNFLFSHTLATIGRGARTLEDLLRRAREFLASDPVRVRQPGLEVEK